MEENIEKQSRIKLSISSLDLCIFLLTICIASAASIFLKLGANKFLFTLNPVDFIQHNYFLMIGYILYVFPSLLTLLLYKKYHVGFVQAILSGVYIVTPILAFFVIGEKFNIVKISGIVIIFISIILLALSTEKK